MNTVSGPTSRFVILTAISGLSACSQPSSPATRTEDVQNSVMRIGEQNQPTGTVGAREDFYRHINGPWLDATAVPDDQGAWGADSELEARTLAQLQGLIEGMGSHPSDRDAQKIVALYTSFMNQTRIEAAGIEPIRPEWQRIDALTGKQSIPALIAHLNQIGIGTPYRILIHQDARDSTRYIVDIRQSGLGLPDRDYYSGEDAALVRARERYHAHVEKMMTLAGAREGSADAILKLETSLARSQWTPVENQNPIKTYNPYRIPDLASLTGPYDWRGFLAAAGIDDHVKSLIISQPSYLTAFGRLVDSIPLETWKTYFKWRVLSAGAPFLSKPFVDEQFAFYGTFLRGIPNDEPRALRAVSLVNEVMGEALGKLYVKQYLKPQTKDQIDAMVQVVMAAFRTRIKSLDWMSEETQKAAQQKLNRLVVKIGNPMQYRSYDKLTIDDDLVGNLNRGALFEYRRNIAKLGQPIQRDEWQVLPQAVAAYYDPQLNEIALPAALLRPPYYDPDADLAVNYGGIGVVIAREISHAFGDIGSQYAADGRLKNWFTGQDHDRFQTKRQALIAQYDAYEPLPGLHVSGALTVSENLADNAGIALAYEAYHLALAGKEARLSDGFTGDQRFFASFSRVGRSKAREQETACRLLSDRYPPAAVRVDGALINQASFAAAFGLEAGDKMYRAAGARVSLW